jgi:biopolymer transport protein ExbD
VKPFRQAIKKSALIELTPLIDVVFILLLFFVLTATFSAPAITLDLPKGQDARTPDHRDLVVSLTADGRLFLDAEAVSRDELKALLVHEILNGVDPSVVLRGERLVLYEDLFSLMDFLKSVGVEEISLAHKTSE